MKRLAGMATLVAAGMAIFSQTGRDVERVFDPAILIYIAAVYTIGIAVMLVWTRKWSLIGCGLLATMTGDALLYARLSRHIPLPDGPWALDLARACFIVGGTYLLVGLIVWTREQAANESIVMFERDVP